MASFIGLFCKRDLIWRSLLIVATPYINMNEWCIFMLRPMAEYSLFYRALLQKRPVILRSLLIVATPYVNMNGWMNDVYSKTKTKYTNESCMNAYDAYEWIMYKWMMCYLQSIWMNDVYSCYGQWQNIASFIGLFCKRDL